MGFGAEVLGLTGLYAKYQYFYGHRMGCLPLDS